MTDKYDEWLPSKTKTVPNEFDEWLPPKKPKIGSGTSTKEVFGILPIGQDADFKSPHEIVSKFIGENLGAKKMAQRLAESENPYIRSYGKSMQSGGIMGLFAPVQWVMSSIVGLSDEATRRWINPDMEEIRRTGEIPDNHPAGLNMSWGMIKKFSSPEEVEKVRKKILRVAEAPIHYEKPIGFLKSMSEARAKVAWAGGEPERYIKDPTKEEIAIRTLAGLVMEVKFDPMTLVHLEKIPAALVNIKDGVIKSSDHYDFARKVFTKTLMNELILKRGEEFDRIKTAYRANWIRANSTEWVAALQRLGSGEKADKYFNLNELASLYAIQRIDPELANSITNINSVDTSKFGLMLGKKQLLNEAQLSKISKKLGITYITEKVRKSLIGRGFISKAKLDITAAEDIKLLSRAEQSTMLRLEETIAPILRKVPKADQDAAHLLVFGEDVLKDYFTKFKKMDEIPATAETLRIAKKYPEIAQELTKHWQQLAKLDKPYGIKYPEIKNYMAGFIDKKYGGKFKIPDFALSKQLEWYQKPKMYANPVEALMAGETPVLNINDIVRIRTQATVKAIYKRIGLDTFDALYGTSHPRAGYELVKSAYLGDRYFPERIAKAIQHEENYFNLPGIPGKIREHVETITNWWKRQVTLRLPTFHGQNLQGGTEVDVMDYGLEALKPANNIIAWDMWRNKNLDDIITTDSGLQYSKRVLKWFIDSTGAGSGHTRSLLSSQPMTKWDPWLLGGAKAGENIEGFMRSRSWWLAFKTTDDPLFATMKTFINHFDYNALTPFEKTFVNLTMAFWTFRKNMIGRSASLMVTEPGRYGQMTDIIRAIEQLAGGRDPEKEPSWFQDVPQIKLPVKYKGHYVYMDVQELPIHALTLPGAVMRAMEAETDPDKEMWIELFKPLLSTIYPWWKTGIQNAINQDMFLNRPIVPKWAEDDPSYRTISQFGFVAQLPKSFREEIGVEYKIIKGQKRLMIKPFYNELFKAVPLSYQVRLLFSSFQYADYEEKQKLFDTFYTLTGIKKLRTIDETYYGEQYQKDMEKRQEEEIKQYLYKLKESGKKRE